MNKKNYHFSKITRHLDDNEFSFKQEIIDPHCIDWRKKYKGHAGLIVFPKTVDKLSNIVKECSKQNISITPQGGNTSLVGGSVPNKNETGIIINLKNINKIREIDELGFSVIVESGCILEDIQNFIRKKNMIFPISMGSRGSCQIGGNIATNAGGLNVIKYGLLRHNILGLEAVMSNGKIYSNLNNIKKNNTGYDLKQLLIGSEGTLGIITAANIKLFSESKEERVIFASFDSFNDLLDFYRCIINSFNDLITSFEMINNDSMELVIKHNSSLNHFIEKGNYYCLVELSNFINIPDFYDLIINNLSKINVTVNSILVSKSQEENTKLWKYREAIPPSETKEKICIQHDISIPLECMNVFLEKTKQKITKLSNDTHFITFGHLGDNNLHFNILSSEFTNYKRLLKNKKKITEIIYENVSKFKGSFSAEHGIGQLKKSELRKYKSKEEIKQMLSIKHNFDPKNILNPGKIF